MRPLAVLARPMISSIFITGGFDAVKSPANKAPAAAKLGLPQPELMVRLNGAAMVLGGAALSIGYKPRRAALLLAATLIPTTYAGHAFWEQEDEGEKVVHQINFTKNLSMLGGLLLAIGDAPHHGTPASARKAAKAVAKAAVASARETEKAERKNTKVADKKGEQIELAAQKAAVKLAAKAEKKVAKLEAKAAKKLAVSAV